MALRMLGVQPGEIGREGCDAFGEICNMIAGNFKNKISGLGNGCMLSVPTIISGDHYNVHPGSGTEAIEVTLLFEGTPISISLQLHHSSLQRLCQLRAIDEPILVTEENLAVSIRTRETRLDCAPSVLPHKAQRRHPPRAC